MSSLLCQMPNLQMSLGYFVRLKRRHVLLDYLSALNKSCLIWVMRDKITDSVWVTSVLLMILKKQAQFFYQKSSPDSCRQSGNKGHCYYIGV